ncbi:MAG: CehA/McbA family metallohydrolase [Clostridia bacterium]|nr:CehA/McbA family metallohydrolase [Clostridia bacterium]
MKKWYPCELHCHTLHSDGSFSVKELLATAEARHLSGICLTDHNTVSGWEEAELYADIPVLKGTEYTTYHGHILSLNAEKTIDCFNISDIDKELKAIRESGGLVGMAHPYQLGTPICTGGRWDYDVKDYSLINYMEIWSEGEMLMTPANYRAKSRWLSLLDEGYRITPTFGRDWHRAEGNKLTGACTFLLIDGEITAEKMKTAIKEGRTQLSLGIFMSIDTDGKTVGDTVKCGKTVFNITLDSSRAQLFRSEYTLYPETIRVITKGNTAVYEGKAADCSLTLETEENSYYIFELWGKLNGEGNHLLALTGAIYT